MPLLSISYKSSVLSPLLNRQSKSANVILVHVFFFNDKGRMGGNVCGNNVAASCGVSAPREACGSQAAFLSLSVQQFFLLCCPSPCPLCAFVPAGFLQLLCVRTVVALFRSHTNGIPCASG